MEKYAIFVLEVRRWELIKMPQRNLQYHCGAEMAFTELRKLSNHSNYRIYGIRKTDQAA